MFFIQLVTNSLSSAPENLADCHLLYQAFILDASFIWNVLPLLFLCRRRVSHALRMSQSL